MKALIETYAPGLTLILVSFLSNKPCVEYFTTKFPDWSPAACYWAGSFAGVGLGLAAAAIILGIIHLAARISKK